MSSDAAGRRVLLVDDAPEVRMLLRLVLELDGWTVQEAADGQAGLSAAEQDQPDVVLLDVQLPDLDGPDVLRALRTTRSTAQVPVVFLTGSPVGDDAALLALGARGVLHKPFDPGSVVAELSALL